MVDLMKGASLLNTGGQERPKPGKAPGANFWYTRKDPVTGEVYAIDFALVSERAAQCNIKF